MKFHQKAQMTVLFYVNSFWWPSWNPAHEIMALISSAYHFTSRPADGNLVQAETTKSFAISLTYMWTIFISNNIPRNACGAPLLSLAKSVYYF